MTKLVTSVLILFLLISCKIQQSNQLPEIIPDKKIIKKIIKIPEKKQSKKTINKFEEKNLNFIKYHIGDPYFIAGVEYIPEENYNYNEIGLANFYGIKEKR